MRLGSSLALLSLLALGGALIITNPSEDDYATFLSQRVSTEAQVALCDPEGFTNWLGRVGAALSQACQGLLAGGETLSESEVQSIIRDSTEYRNWLFFSTYVTQTPFGDYKAIGVFDRFILNAVDSEPETTSEQADE